MTRLEADKIESRRDVPEDPRQVDPCEMIAQGTLEHQHRAPRSRPSLKKGTHFDWD